MQATTQTNHGSLAPSTTDLSMALSMGLSAVSESLAELSLPRIDFNSLIRDQLEKARSLKARVLAPPSAAERLLNFIEGPWAPEALDLPEKKVICQKDALNRPFRTTPENSRVASDRYALKSRAKNSERRIPISKWTTAYLYDVPIKGMHQALDGFTILHLSDIHLLKWCDRPWQELHNIADFLRARRDRCDAILLSGDVITKGPQDLCDNSLRGLRRISSLCSRSFMVYGNHDYHGHVPAFISKQLADVGFHDINNHHIRLNVGTAALNIYGVDDAYFGSPSTPQEAPINETNLILTHNLDSIRRRCTPHIDLILSGHTHWGEIRFLDGSKLMNLWGYCDNVNNHTRHWDMLTDRALSYVHPGLARYYIPFKSLRYPPGIAIHTLRTYNS